MTTNPRGKFDNFLAMDCETTGLCFNNDDPSEGFQSVSWGLLVVDANTLNIKEEKYVEIKWNNESKKRFLEDESYGKYAEGIHKLTFEHLEAHGMSEEDAVVDIAEMILKYWGPTGNIATLGHNVATFDNYFFRRLMRSQHIEFPFGNRHIDTFSLGLGTIGSFNSDDLFSTMGLDERTSHNALEDVKFALESFRRIRMLWRSKVGITAYE